MSRIYEPKDRSPSKANYYGLSGNWRNLSKRLSAAGQQALKGNSSGMAVVSVICLVDSDGDVVMWLDPTVKRVEPSKNAKETLSKIFSGFEAD